MLKFTTEDVSGVLVVAFEATDEHATDWQFGQRDWLYKLVESHKDPRFAIDLSEVNYLASSEIGFLVTLKRRIDRRQGQGRILRHRALHPRDLPDDESDPNP